MALEDPALPRSPNKVIVWSFPIIKDGLIYVIDVRNGLYILRYTASIRARCLASTSSKGTRTWVMPGGLLGMTMTTMTTGTTTTTAIMMGTITAMMAITTTDAQ